MFEDEGIKAPTPIEVAAGARSLEDIVDEINKQHDRTIESVKKLAYLCAEAEALSKGEEKRFFAQLKFDRSKFNKYVQIGKCKHMWSPEIESHLPSGYSSLYQVALLSDEQRTRAVKDGLLHPKCTRNELVDLKAKLRAEKEEPPHRTENPEWTYAQVRLTRDLTQEDQQALDEGLDLLEEKYGVEIVRSDDLYAETRERYAAKVNAKVRDAVLQLRDKYLPTIKKRKREVRTATNLGKSAGPNEMKFALIALGFADPDSKLKELEREAQEQVPMPRLLKKMSRRQLEEASAAEGAEQMDEQVWKDKIPFDLLGNVPARDDAVADGEPDLAPAEQSDTERAGVTS